jgi:hypothetical protein
MSEREVNVDHGRPGGDQTVKTWMRKERDGSLTIIRMEVEPARPASREPKKGGGA